MMIQETRAQETAALYNNQPQQNCMSSRCSRFIRNPSLTLMQSNPEINPPFVKVMLIQLYDHFNVVCAAV